VNIWNNIADAYRRYATFKGASSRSQYWTFQIFFIVVFFALILFALPVALLFAAGSLVPMFAVGFRRFADGGYPRALYPSLIGLSLLANLDNLQAVSLCVGVVVAVLASLRPGNGALSAVTTYQPMDGVTNTASFCDVCGKMRLPGQNFCQGCGKEF
jgi:uncharacterized membrane protein YhaH (DUF805 family)